MSWVAVAVGAGVVSGAVNSTQKKDTQNLNKKIDGINLRHSTWAKMQIPHADQEPNMISDMIQGGGKGAMTAMALQKGFGGGGAAGADAAANSTSGGTAGFDQLLEDAQNRNQGFSSGMVG